MPNIGTLSTEKSIEFAIKEIQEWLSKINVNGIDIDLRYDAKINIALLRFKYKGKNYEFRSTKQKNCRLNMWGIARVMEFKVRAHLMSIEDFDASMSSYKLIEGKIELIPEQSVSNEINYVKLGLSPLASTDEIKERYKQLIKTYHPDRALSADAKEAFNEHVKEINTAYAAIKIERGIQ